MFSEYSVKIPNNVTFLVVLSKNRYSICIGKRRKDWESRGCEIPIKFHACKHVGRLQLKEAQRDPLVNF